MINEWLDKQLCKLEDHLRAKYGKVSPEKRLVIVLVMLLLFSGFSIYLFASAVYKFGKDEGRQIEIEHMRVLELQQKEKRQINAFEYGREYDNGYDEEFDEPER